MKIKNNISVDLKRENGCLRGFIVVDGKRQLVDIVPQNIESSDLFSFISLHVMPVLENGREGRVAFRKGKS